MSTLKPYSYEKLDYSHLKGLKGISDDQLEVHFGLYAGYVANTNKTNEEVASAASAGNAGTPAWAEMNRRLGWEYNGMRLHEYYFGNLAPGGKGDPGPKLKAAVEKTFGSFEKWKDDFMACAGMRGIGWVILYQDQKSGAVSNHWITEHEMNHPSGFVPVLVMDMWEHAYMVDHKPSDKKKYVEAFFDNIDWDAVEGRLA